MEPIRALLATDVELGFVIGLLADTVNFHVFTGIAALVANVLGHGLGHGLRDPDARPVEPIAANVTADIEPGSGNIKSVPVLGTYIYVAAKLYGSQMG